MGLPWDSEQSGQAAQPTPTPSEGVGAAAAPRPWEVPPQGFTLGTAPREPSTDAARGVLTGLRKGLVPFAVTEREYNRITSRTEAVIDVGANIVSGIAAGAALGSVIPGIGTVAGATVGALTYGLYAGIGNEVMRSRAQGEEFNPLRAAANVALEANPIVKAASKVAAGARVAAQIAGSGGVEYWYSNDVKAAGLAAIGAGVVSPLVYRGLKPTQLVPSVPEAADAVMKMFREDTGAQLLSKASERMKAAPPQLSELNDPKVKADFSRWVINDFSASEKAVAKEAAKRLPKYSAKQLEDLYTSYKFQKTLVDEAGKVRDELMAGLGYRDPIGTVSSKFADPHFVGRKLDEVTGLNMSGVFDGFSKAKDGHNVRAAAHLTQADKARKWQDLAGIDNKEMGRALAGKPVSKATQAALQTEAGQNASRQWRSVFDTLRLDIEKAGYDIGYLHNYIPMKSLEGVDLYDALTSKVSQLKAQSMASGKPMREANPELFKELSDVAALKLGKKDLTDQDLLNLPETALGVNKEKQGYALNSILERRGEMAEWLQEYDVGKLFAKYIATNLKAVDYDAAFRNLNAHMSALEALGLEKSAQYLKDYSRHMSGDPGWVPSVLQTVGDEIRLAGRRMQMSGTQAGQKFGKAVEVVPDFLGWMNTMYYPAFLGTNAKAALRNMTQVYQTTAPEIGGSYGYRLTSKAVVDSVADLRKMGGLKGAEDWLKAKNQLGDITKYDVVVNPNTLSSKLRKHADKVNEWAMAAYSLTDTANRFITMKVGERWAKDLVAGKAEAFKALRNLGAGAKAQGTVMQINKLIKEGNVEAVGDFLGDWLITKTQFRYGREQQSFFNREAGTLFSAFTKWPVMVTSDIVDAYRKGPLKGTVRNGAKYLAPLMALMGTSAVLEPYAEEPAFQYLVGDLTSLSPLPGALNVVQFGGPAMRTVGELPKVARDIGGAEDKLEAAGKVAGAVGKGVLKTFVPGVSSVVNELDRYSKAHGVQGPSEELLDWELP